MAHFDEYLNAFFGSFFSSHHRKLQKFTSAPEVLISIYMNFRYHKVIP